jgi:hypothetical protein
MCAQERQKFVRRPRRVSDGVEGNAHE